MAGEAVRYYEFEIKHLRYRELVANLTKRTRDYIPSPTGFLPYMRNTHRPLRNSIRHCRQ
jgi:hypothetical protein